MCRKDHSTSIAIGSFLLLRRKVERAAQDRHPHDARRVQVVRGGTSGLLGIVSLGLAIGVAGAWFVEALLFEVKATDAGIVAAPIVTLSVVALLTALSPAIRASRIDPAQTLRHE